MNNMAAFVLIQGGCQGGWEYQKVAAMVAAHGHRAVAITLSGLGDVPASTVNLDAHTREVIDVVKSHCDDLIQNRHAVENEIDRLVYGWALSQRWWPSGPESKYDTSELR